MKNSGRNIRIAVIALAGGLATASCTEVADDPIFAAPLFGGGSDIPQVVSSDPFQGQTDVAQNKVLALQFNKFVDESRCTSAFTLSPSVTGFSNFAGEYFFFTPNFDLGDGSYTMTMGEECADQDGRNILNSYSVTFTVGQVEGPFGTPVVQAVGLASQGCPETFPGSGSSGGGDHTLGTCWWDNSLV